jgi:hypothetical protein
VGGLLGLRAGAWGRLGAFGRKGRLSAAAAGGAGNPGLARVETHVQSTAGSQRHFSLVKGLQWAQSLKVQ